MLDTSRQWNCRREDPPALCLRRRPAFVKWFSSKPLLSNLISNFPCQHFMGLWQDRMTRHEVGLIVDLAEIAAREQA